jgi:hypothetical protein
MPSEQGFLCAVDLPGCKTAAVWGNGVWVDYASDCLSYTLAYLILCRLMMRPWSTGVLTLTGHFYFSFELSDVREPPPQVTGHLLY